jgi:hypothetical protein
VADDDGGNGAQVPGDDEVEAGRRRLEELTRAHGQDDDRALAAAESLAMLHYARQETAEALALMRRVAGARSVVAAADDTAELTRRRMLSTLLTRSGKLDEALVEHEGVVAATLAAFGADSRPALASRYNHAMLLQEMGDTEGAAALFAAVAEEAAHALGPDDVVTRAAAAQVG